MRVKILVALLMSLVTMSMFATNTRTSAAPNGRPLLSYTPEPNISIDMYELYGDGLLKDKKCAPGSTSFGCTAFCDNRESGYEEWCVPGEPIEPYPYESSTIVVPIQTYYLLDVLAGEMSPSPDWMPIPTALRAQAIAARSYAWWQYEFNKPMNNSNSFQVYVPYRFDKLNLKAAPMEPTILTPCDPYRFRNEPQEMECDAIAPQYYLSSWNDDLPAFAMFYSDVTKNTVAYPEQEKHPYLVGVEEPISTACDASDFGHGWGMSQWGAARWARGDRCALAANGPAPWSVVWDRAEQILFHYFTRVHLRDANNGKQILSPDWRWNPLQIEWGTPDNQPPVMVVGQTYAVPIQIQNTSMADWACRVGDNHPDTPLSYRLRYRWLNGSTVIYTSTGLPMCNVLAGSAKNDLLQVYVPSGLSGTYTLRLDMYETLEDFWFSDSGWPPYDVPVQIIPPPNPTPTPTSCGYDC